MIKAIAFDLQFTLVYLEDFSLTKWFQLFDEGFIRVKEYLKGQNFNFDEKKLFRTLRRMRNRHFTKTITDDQQYYTEEILKDTFLKNNIQLSPEELIKCVKIYHSVEIPAWKPRPKLREILETLSNKYKLVLITNASKFVTDGILEFLKIQEYFYFSFTKARKPRLDSFIKFKEMMNCGFNELVMVGDDRKVDITPAMELGMKTIHFYRGYEYLKHHALLDLKPDKEINKIEDLLSAIKELED